MTRSQPSLQVTTAWNGLASLLEDPAATACLLEAAAGLAEHDPPPLPDPLRRVDITGYSGSGYGWSLLL